METTQHTSATGDNSAETIKDSMQQPCGETYHKGRGWAAMHHIRHSRISRAEAGGKIQRNTMEGEQETQDWHQNWVTTINRRTKQRAEIHLRHLAQHNEKFRMQTTQSSKTLRLGMNRHHSLNIHILWIPPRHDFPRCWADYSEFSTMLLLSDSSTGQRLWFSTALHLF